MSYNIIAWREILARVFAGFTEQENVSPEWLINPATRRRLKLDKLYPEAGIAVRFVGLVAKGQGRLSDWEVLETEQRDQTRAELCRLNGIQLVLIDPEEDPVKQLDHLLRVLARASRTLAQSDQPAPHKQRWMPALNRARTTTADLRARVARTPEQMMGTLAEGWRDREAGLASQPTVIEPAPRRRARTVTYAVGQRVRHDRFGPGVITALRAEESDTTLTVLFDGEQERTFLLSLVEEKLAIL
ncbi:MAG: hypothetical protein DCC55_10715 [Chloroflexi bacterium]|nr:MAG: hypothetical protein DCC55_10715 [Chloroflexota bacterium]